MVRAVGIEPTLLAERDFEFNTATIASRRDQASNNGWLANAIANDKIQPIFRIKCVRMCVSDPGDLVR